MITIFPCLSDNYGFLVHEPKSGLTAAIDAPDAKTILQQCQQLGVNLTHVFNTHHHFDHVGGNAKLKQTCNVTIIGPKTEQDRITCIDKAVSGGDSFEFGEYTVHVLHTPGHTLGHCAYYIPMLGSVFVGDTLFALGCGRLFEGSPAQMYESLGKLAALPDDTKVYCAHEYTLSNGEFAITAEPDNTKLAAYLDDARRLRANNAPTVPTTIRNEKACNPFMRAATPEILGMIRAAKDKF